MTINTAIEQLLEVEAKRKEGGMATASHWFMCALIFGACVSIQHGQHGSGFGACGAR